ncbi:NUDIX hydrolase [Paenibacillus ginsengarvi]|uniref:8-oxo-dGTP diphosphatase n=1 Tax=Paenibacillus ginsengarvi TaxID=400777 RepID=A0A3B0CU51_9BACL|nr:8-oxo-dGTP diphosphatase [Paenibacillus ginsengarvi]RKN86577.1 8-oxo-dGTP diphosphatase [Paenibacillus ginsengarvi]
MSDEPSIPYTLLFIRQGSKLLMLNRDKAPAKGLWNGVGGKLEAGEAPLEGVLREAFEETEIRLAAASFKGIVWWESHGAPAVGMYLFTAELPEDEHYETPRRTEEGLLEWKEIGWVLSDHNLGVGEAIPKYLPAMLNEDCPYIHICRLDRNRMTGYERKKDWMGGGHDQTGAMAQASGGIRNMP